MLTLYLLVRLLVWLFKVAISMVVFVFGFLALSLYGAIIAVVLLAVLFQVGRKIYWERRLARLTQRQ